MPNNKTSLSYRHYPSEVLKTTNTSLLDSFMCSCDSLKCTASLPRSLPLRSVPRTATKWNFSLIVLLLCGDIELNPGPSPKYVFPCGYCQLPVNWSDLAVYCNECSIWYHKSCHEIPTRSFSNQPSKSWTCGKSDTFNWCDSTVCSDLIQQPHHKIHYSTPGAPLRHQPNIHQPLQHRLA